MFLRWLEILAFVLIVIFFATQVFVPMWRGTRLFPIFRRRQRQLERELAATREAAIEAELDQQLRMEQERLRQPKGKREDGTSAPGS